MRIIMLTRHEQAAQVLPSASFLDSEVLCLSPVPSSYAAVEDADVVLVDATGDLTRARALCQLLSGPMDCPPILLVLQDGGAAVVQADWGASCRRGCGCCAPVSRRHVPRRVETALRSVTS